VAPDTHPTPSARLDRLRLFAPVALDSARPGAFKAASSLESKLHRLFILIQDRLASDPSLIPSPVIDVVNGLSEPDKDPSEEIVQQFVGRVAWWLTLGSPEKVMTSLGQLKADAARGGDKGGTGLVKGFERFLSNCGDEAASLALQRLGFAEQFRLNQSPHPRN
jgi:hypothetical protein